MLELHDFEVLSFDCYGTIIDWEQGILTALRDLLDKRGIHPPDDELLVLFSRHETVVQRPPFKRYVDVLSEVSEAIGQDLGLELTPEERRRFAESVRAWPPFEDSVASLQELNKHFDLVILSNVDDDLFKGSAAQLQVDFADVITAEQVKSYKPSARNFEVLIERIGKPKQSILHVAQSLYHDIAPANAIGLSTVWINRRAGKSGGGATPPQQAVPDLELPSLAALATLVERSVNT